MAIAGIDIGTTGCKCSVYSNEAEFLNEAYQEYDIIKSSGQHELDMEMVWEAVQGVVKKACEKVRDIQAIGITSFGETFVLSGEDGKPLMKAMLYTDSRGDKECLELQEHFGAKKIGQITGVKPHKMMSVSKLMWVTKNKKEIYQKVKHINLIAGYITYRFCGNAMIDYSLAARTMMFDIKKLDWNDEILKFTGIDRNKMPKPVPTGTLAGTIKAEIAKRLGLSSDVKIVIGCHDQVAASIGSGILEPGMAADGAGTVECITPLFQGEPKGDILYDGGYAVVPYVIPKTYVTYAFSFTGGALLKWYRDQLCSMESKLSKNLGVSAYDIFNLKVVDKPTSLLILPHFSGAATPYMDDNSRGAIIGLTTETTSIEIYQALMEAVTYEMNINIEELKKAGINVTHLQATGGGARSPFWLQMKSDILNVSINSLGASQAGTLGCIMLAGVACGIYKDLTQAKEKFIKVEKTYYPRKEMHELYMENYRKYKRLYPAVKEILNND